MIFRTALVLGAISLAVCASASAQDPADFFVDRKVPVYPQSELRNGREGWVVVRYLVTDNGTVVDPTVIDSSGSDAFEKAAVDAISEWRVAPEFKPGDSSVLINFVFDSSRPMIRRSFKRDYLKIGKLIRNNELGKAHERLEKLVGRDLYPTEVAYTWIARANLAEVAGDKIGQLRCFRMAMIGEGQWLDRHEYLNLLKATTVLAIQTGDYASAVRDFGLLTETGVGERLGADIAGAVAEARTRVADRSPYSTAATQLDVSHERPRSPVRSRDFPGGWPSGGGDERGSHPPGREPAPNGDTNTSG